MLCIIYLRMERLTPNAGLGILSQNQIAIAEMESPIRACSFNIVQFEGQNDRVVEVKLEIRENFLLQIGQGNKIICGFAFDFEVKFEIIRQYSEGQPRHYKVTGIDFILPESRRVSLIGRKEEMVNVQSFISVLKLMFISEYGFHQYFQRVKVLGRGNSATVYWARRSQPSSGNPDVAIKGFSKKEHYENAEKKALLLNQLKIMSSLRRRTHRNLVRMEGIYETDNHIYLVMEIFHSTLFQSIVQKEQFSTQDKIRQIIQQILLGTNKLHSMKIMHRDLKLENVMITQNGDAKIVDFGLAQKWSNEKYIVSRCGSPGYVAPEIITQAGSPPASYDGKVDIFSIGIIFYMLVFKKQPFTGNDLKEVLMNNKQCQIQFSDDSSNRGSEEALALMKKMLQKDPKNRFSALEALAHPYFQTIKPSTASTTIQIISPSKIKSD